MRTPRTTPYVLATVLVLSACGGDDPAGPDDPLSAFVGTWAGISMVFTPQGGGQPFDAILAGGSLSITISGSGSFNLSFAIPGVVSETDTGTISVSGNQMTMSFASDGSAQVGTFAFTQGGSRLTFSASQGVTFDFNQDDVDDPATLSLVLQKR